MKGKFHEGWTPLSPGETSVPNVVSQKFVPIVTGSGIVTSFSNDGDDLVVRSSSPSSVLEISRLENFRLVDAIPYGDDILVAAVWTRGGYPRESLSVDQFNGATYTFWRHAPFIFVLRKSESFVYFNSFSSTNETPFPLISMNSSTTNAIATDGSQVFVTSVVKHAGVWRQAVSYCNDGGQWDMMNKFIFPFSELPAATQRGVCDITYDSITGDPVAMFLTDQDLSIRFFDSSSSVWKNWRGYDIVCIVDGGVAPPPTSSSSSSSSNSFSSSSNSFSSCSSSSSSQGSSEKTIFGLSWTSGETKLIDGTFSTQANGSRWQANFSGTQTLSFYGYGYESSSLGSVGFDMKGLADSVNFDLGMTRSQFSAS